MILFLFSSIFFSSLSLATTIDRIHCALTIKDAKSHFKNTHTVEFQSPRFSSFLGDIQYFESESRSRSKIATDEFQFGFSYVLRSVQAVRKKEARHKICVSYRMDICKKGICQEELFSCDFGSPFDGNGEWAVVDVKNGVPDFSSDQLPRSLAGQFRFKNEVPGFFLLVCNYGGSFFVK
jgi:hypothetical protein